MSPSDTVAVQIKLSSSPAKLVLTSGVIWMEDTAYLKKR